MMFSCVSPSNRDSVQTVTKKSDFNNTIYVLDENNIGQYHTIVFKEDETVEGAEFIGINNDVTWEFHKIGKYIQNDLINLTLPDSTKGRIKFNTTKSDYKGTYEESLPILKVLSVKKSSGDIFLTYSTDISTINKIKAKYEYTIAALDSLQKGTKAETIYKINNNDDIDNLFMAYKNDKEFPTIYNTTTYKGDEFSFNIDKPKFIGIRNKKYILWKFNKIDNLPEYDFKSKAFVIKTSIDGRGVGIKIPEESPEDIYYRDQPKRFNTIIYTQPLSIKVKPDIAKEIRDNKDNAESELFVLFQVSGTKILKLKNRKCTNPVYLDGWVCFSSQDEPAPIKQIILKPLRYVFYYKGEVIK